MTAPSGVIEVTAITIFPMNAESTLNIFILGIDGSDVALKKQTIFFQSVIGIGILENNLQQ